MVITKRHLYIASSQTIILLLAGFSIFLSNAKPPEQKPVKAASKSIVYSVTGKAGLESSTAEKLSKIESDPTTKASQVLSTASEIGDISSIASFTFPLFGEGNVTFNKDSVKNAGSNIKVWKAKKVINGINYRSYVAYSKTTGSLNGLINLPTAIYTLSSVNFNKVIVQQKDITKRGKLENPLLGRGLTNDEGYESGLGLNAATSGKEIDVLIAYTERVGDHYWDNFDEMHSSFLGKIEFTNTIFSDSGILHHLRFVGMVPMPSHEVRSCETTLYRLQDQSDNYFVGIDNIRREHGADIVVLIINPVGGADCGGRAFLYPTYEKAYALVNIYDLWNTAFPHEIGHLFGADHDKEHTTGGSGNPYFTYGHGLQIPEVQGYTIMAYPQNSSCNNGVCIRDIQYFTNPARFYEGYKIGSTDAANNTRVINEAGPGVANMLTSAMASSPNYSPNGTGNGTCGSYCHTEFDCDPNGGYTCKDVGNGAKNCWNESLCGGPALKARIEGYVRSCSGQPLSGIKVRAWGNTTPTDNNGRFRLVKGVDHTNIRTMETSIMAGNDAARVVEGQDKYFTNNYANLSLRSAPQGCAIVNCAFNTADSNNPNKLLNGGPARNAYYIPSTMSDDTFEYNFVFTDQYAKSFDFKPPNCFACNQTCTSDSQCSATNANWYCGRQYNYTGWTNVTSYFNTPGSGTITDLNLHLNSNNQMEEHVVRGGQVYYRLNTGSGGSFSNVTTNLDNEVGCTAPYPVLNPTDCTNSQGVIKTFNSYTYPESGNVTNTEQHVIRVKGSTVKLFSRDSMGGWGSWLDKTSGVNDIGNVSGQNNTLNSFTSYYTEDSYRMQTLVRGGRVYIRAISGFYGWGDNTSFFNSCGANGSCGYATLNGVPNPIVAYELVKKQNNQVDRYLLRADGQVYKSTSLPLEEKCRLKSKPWSLTCQ